MSIRSADPISIVSCLECRTHLPDGDRRTFLAQVRTLKSLDRLEVGDLVDPETLYTLLCEGCAQSARRLHHEQVRAERLTRHARKDQLRKMASKNLSEYRRTPEWEVLRNRKLIMAGNRCQVCGTTAKPLDCHHNSYERLGDELLEDLVILCRTCHYHYHDILPKVA
jgi:5-methylcytosine-specific restriction endonuclease McrA